jgi:Protein of unknown function (DUF2491)
MSESGDRMIFRSPASPQLSMPWRKVLFCCLCCFLVLEAPDRASGQYSSGGYSRPGGRATSDYSAPSRRASVSSGGYSRRPYAGAGYTTGSSGDRAVSRSVSSQALLDYRTAERPAETYARRPPSYAGGSDWSTEAPRRPPIWGGEEPALRVARGPALPGSGPLTAVALWAALNSLSSPSSVQYFHNYQYDPGYAQWRREADREARSNPAVAAKLDQLDTQLAQTESQPRNPSAAPPAQPSQLPSGGSGFILPVLFIGIVVLVLLWLWRRRLAQPVLAAATPGLAGSAATRFRVGMTMPVDPSPFVLAAGLTKVQPPEGGGMVSVEVVGVLRDGAVMLHRLYLPGGKAFFQLHLGSDGRPDECRYFSRLDEVTPADRQEWGLWLDPSEGMIGWPSFQTKDGKMYGRVWAPSNSRVPPRKMEESLQYVDHVERRQLQMMLYGGPTGGTPPAPETEYILVSAIEAAGQAWVDIDAGIDINPAALTLPSVPLAA